MNIVKGPKKLDERNNHAAPEIVRQVTERVYQMLLQDLVIERERHRLMNPSRRQRG